MMLWTTPYSTANGHQPALYRGNCHQRRLLPCDQQEISLHNATARSLPQERVRMGCAATLREVRYSCTVSARRAERDIVFARTAFIGVTLDGERVSTVVIEPLGLTLRRLWRQNWRHGRYSSGSFWCLHAPNPTPDLSKPISARLPPNRGGDNFPKPRCCR